MQAHLTANVIYTTRMKQTKNEMKERNRKLNPKPSLDLQQTATMVPVDNKFIPVVDEAHIWHIASTLPMYTRSSFS